ncbi:MAG: hypothetical protein KDA44_05590 [Planctomycetales bacterium]|nr:hypothetical protein [Planctomycetales bacterium]
MLLSELESPPSYRAPQQDGGCVSIPAWSTLPALIDGAAAHSPGDVEILGQPLAELQRTARAELLTAAQAYVAGYAAGVRGVAPDRPLVVVGHQPELVHPGVWLKNFAAAELARQSGGTALHLVIDTDSAHSPTTRVPTGPVTDAAINSVAFDSPHMPMAWEQRRISDAGLWDSFGDRVGTALESLGVNPFIRDWWPRVLERSAATGSPGLAMAQARHLTELAWGAETLELPQSTVCQSGAFRRFACHLVAHLPRFSAAYNEALAAFRRRHGIRNHAQPMPNLADDGEWLEAPLWLWSNDDPTRRALFARQRGDAIELTDRDRFCECLPLSADGDPAEAIGLLGGWESRGVKLRSRALVTTLFARLALADLFIHGIGGARYDEVADRLSREFFGIDPAPYAAISGTLRLPIKHQRATESDVRSLNRQLRDMEFHPEKFFDPIELPAAEERQAAEWRAAKREWISTAKTPQNARERHLAIAEANRRLTGLLLPLRQETERRLAAARSRLRTTAVLESREYAFCLFPREQLRGFLLDFAARLA